MSEYIDWQPDDKPVRVRVHRRVMAGIEQESADEFRGVLLGSASPVTREVLVEDFARLESGAEFRPLEDWFAGWNRHSLPAVGYFRAGVDDTAEITEKDRELFARYFRDKLNVLLLFRIHDGKAALAPVPAGLDAPRETERPPDIDAGTRAPMWEGDLPQRVGELAAWTEVPRQEGAERLAELPAAERERPRAEAAVEPGPSRRTPRRYLAQVGAVAAGFLLGVFGYLALRGDRPRQVAPAEAPVSRSATQPAGRKASPASPATPDTIAAATPVTPASTPRPSPFDRSAEANRSVDPGAGRAPAVDRGDAQQQIRSTITRWADTLVDGNLDAHVNLYAPTVSPYFTKRNASRAQIGDDVRQMLGRYGKMTVYKISDVNVTPVDANHAFVTFRKEWETEGKKFSGEEREQFKMTRKGADWLIASEREVKVFWVKKK